MYVANAEALHGTRCCPPCVEVALRCPQYGDPIYLGPDASGWTLRGRPLDLRPRYPQASTTDLVLSAAYMTADAMTAIVTRQPAVPPGVPFDVSMSLYTQTGDTWTETDGPVVPNQISGITNATGATATRFPQFVSTAESASERTDTLFRWTPDSSSSAWTPSTLAQYTGPSASENAFVAFSPDGTATIAYPRTGTNGEQFVLERESGNLLTFTSTAIANSNTNQMSASASGLVAAVLVGRPGGQADVQVLELTAGQWSAISQTFQVNGARPAFPPAVTISGDGQVIAIIETDNSGTTTARAYRRPQSATTWTLRGGPIPSPSPVPTGGDVRLNHDGTTLVWGSGGQPDAIHIQAHRFDGSSWSPSGGRLPGMLIDVSRGPDTETAVLVAKYGLDPPPTQSELHSRTLMTCLWNPAVLAVYTLD